MQLLLDSLSMWQQASEERTKNPTETAEDYFKGLGFCPRHIIYIIIVIFHLNVASNNIFHLAINSSMHG